MKRIAIFLIFACQAGLLLGSAGGDDDAIYLDERMKETKKKHATYYCELVEQTEKGYHYKAYFLSGELKMDGWYSDEEMTQPHGPFTFYYKSGQVESTGEYRDGEKYGIWQRYDIFGNEKAEKVYAYLPMLRQIGKKN
jgi:antitoxin component YwqK of YwqJK toxin-antitoxin module